MPNSYSQSLSVDFYVCSWDKAQQEVQKQRSCDWWIYQWPSIDYYWLFGNYYWWQQPQPDFSPLASSYYNKIVGELNTAVSQAISSCESRRYPPQPTTQAGLSLRVAGHLDHGGSLNVGSRYSGLGALFAFPFTATANKPVPSPTPTTPKPITDPTPNPTPTPTPVPPPPPVPCQALPRELFAEPVDFSYHLPGPTGGNFRWEWRDQQTIPPEPYFELYGRTMKFVGSSGSQYLGSVHLIIDRMAELWVRFENRPIPASVADRVDPAQAIQYQVSAGVGYFGIAAVIEVLHVESGEIFTASVHGKEQSIGYMQPWNWWPQGWETMTPDASGVIRHYNVDWFYWLSTLEPSYTGLPSYGTFRMRYILLSYGYRTEQRYVSSTALSSTGDNRMSWKPIWLSHMPSLIMYTPGVSEGLIPPFEYTYTRAVELSSGIEFDAVFDLKNITTFRFVVKVKNNHDFALGLIVQASGWQSWVQLAAGETKYLSGAVSVSGMFNWNAYPLHPQSPYYGWTGGWSSSYISMYNGKCQVSFGLFLTAPTQPETFPANLPQKKATQRWYWDTASFAPTNAPEWGMIKRYASDGRYDYEYNLSAYNLGVGQLKSVVKSITKPTYQTLINPATYFVTGYDTSQYDWSSPWHKRLWPGYTGWSGLTAPIMMRGERQTWNGSSYVWVWVDQIQISLSRALMQQVAAFLGVTEYVVMDGDDIRWFQVSPTGAWHNVLWIDRFYTRSGTLIDDAAMRNAFATVIANNAASWPGYRNMSVHPSVRFGSFLDNGGFEVGDYLLSENGDMIEVASLNDLNSVSTKFLYHIATTFQ